MKKKKVPTPLKPIYKILYYILFSLAWVLVRIMFPIRVIGKKNLKKGGFVLAPNHVNALDPLFVVLARGFGKKMLIMGKEELFNKNIFLDFFLNISGTFPVNRGSGDKEALNEAIEDVKNGRGLLIFPEGTRSKDGKLGRLKSGAFVVAMQTETDMIPCSISYKGGNQNVKPFHRVTVVFGEPMSMQELDLAGEYSPAKLRVAKQKYTFALEELAAKNVELL